MAEQRQYALFKSYHNEEEAKRMAERLDEAGIEYKVLDTAPSVDLTFTGGAEAMNETQIAVFVGHFKKALEVMEQESIDMIDQVDDSHYLYQFSNEELHEVLTKYDEWSAFDYKLSQKILRERGEAISDEQIEELKQKRLEVLAEPKGGQKGWILVGYLFAILGGLFGVAIGYSLMSAKNTLPDGNKVHVYTEEIRNHGRKIFYVGLVLFVVELLLGIFTDV